MVYVRIVVVNDVDKIGSDVVKWRMARTQPPRYRQGHPPPQRWFGSPMLFKADGPGRWICEDEARGYTYMIERRRTEPGSPAGWYYFGPGTEVGVFCGDYAEGAAAEATKNLRLG
jgi:hypothetical protein